MIYVPFPEIRFNTLMLRNGKYWMLSTAPNTPVMRMAIEIKTKLDRPKNRIRAVKSALNAVSPITTNTDPNTNTTFKASQIGS